MNPVFAVREEVTDRKYHAVHVRPIGHVVRFTHVAVDFVERWIREENERRAKLLAQMNEKVRNDDLSDYPRLEGLTGQEREDEKVRLIAWNDDTMAPLNFVIVEETLTLKPLEKKS